VLAGIPSVVYGVWGILVVVPWVKDTVAPLFGVTSTGYCVLAGGIVLAVMIFPVIIHITVEILRAVPREFREASLSLGATRWQTVRHHVLPSALPGMLTGVILALSRAIGEAAPLIMIGALSYIAFTPKSPMDDFTALPIQIFNWTSRPQKDFHSLAAAGIIVLLVVLLLMNAAAVAIRYRAQRARR